LRQKKKIKKNKNLLQFNQEALYLRYQMH